MSRITHSSEAADLLRHTALDLGDLVAMGVQAARHSFLGIAAREQALARLTDWAGRRSIEVPMPLRGAWAG